MSVDPSGSAPVVHLHIGTMKTGTSYLQHILDHQRDALASGGIRYPGSTGRAVNDVLGRRGTASLGDTTGAWQELVEDVRAWSGPSYLVSMEFLALASRRQLRQIRDSLAPSRVRAVLTMRDLVRTIPSAWQQTTKNRGTTAWPDFLESVIATADDDETAPVADDAGTDPDAGRQFWRHHDAVAIARRWATVLGADSVTVVLVPPRGAAPELLWERFGEAVGIDTAQVQAAGAGRGNPSLGYAEAELMRRLNGRLTGAMNQEAYRRLVTSGLARRVLRAPAGGATPAARLPADAYEWAAQRSRLAQEQLLTLGVRVVGDAAELVPPPWAPADSDAQVNSGSTDLEVSRLAVAASVTLLKELAELPSPERRGRRARRAV